jgi:polar amino acid transport system permease protein
MTPGSPAAPLPASETPPAVPLAPIVEQVAAAQRRRRRRYRLLFAGTWVVLIALILLLLGPSLDLGFLAQSGWYILGGVYFTILLSVLSIALAVVLALAGALGRLSPNPVINAVASFYVSVIRGTPLLVQIFFWFYALAEIGIVLEPLHAGVLALGVNYGAYMTEIFRAGIQAVPRGQREAAQALGMRERLVMRRIVLPQAIRIVVPAIGNEFIAMIKDTSLVSVIAIQELLWRATTQGRRTINILDALLFAALAYWILTILFSFVQQWLERRMARSDR